MKSHLLPWSRWFTDLCGVLVASTVIAGSARAEVDPAGEPQGTPQSTRTITQTGNGANGAKIFWGESPINLLQDVLITVRDPADEALGATLTPVPDPLRAQLALPTGQGVIVASVAGDGPAARAGLEQNDILLTLAGKPLAEADDLSEQLKDAGKSPVALSLLRKGKPVTINVRPVFRVTLDAADREAATDYHIGVALNALDEALRAHLELPEGKGLIVTQVVSGSPAEKAGVKTHDIVLELGGKPVDSSEALVAQVQAAKDKPTPLKILRSGKPLSIEITPERRVAPSKPHRETLRLWSLGHQAHPEMYPAMPLHPPGFEPRMYRFTPNPAEPDPTTRRLDALDKELKELHKAIDELRDVIKKEK